MIRWFAILGLAFTCAASEIIFVESALAQEIKRTDLGRSPVSGDDTKEIVMQIAEYPPGAVLSRHFHNGEESFYILEGGTFQAPGKEPKERVAGERGINQRGVAHGGVTVVGDKTIKILSVFVVDKGKPLQEPSP